MNDLYNDVLLWLGSVPTEHLLYAGGVLTAVAIALISFGVGRRKARVVYLPSDMPAGMEEKVRAAVADVKPSKHRRWPDASKNHKTEAMRNGKRPQ